MTNPLVSVIIPCYNQGRFLAEAIESALGQTYPHVEVVVVNDGSTDETSEVAARYEGRIKYIQQENSGVSVARNRGILESKGDYLLFLDADDTMDAGVLEALLRTACEGGPNTLAVCGYRVTDAEGIPKAEFPVGEVPEDFFHSVLAAKYFTPVHTLLVPRHLLAKAGLFDCTLKFSEDRDLWLRLALAGGHLRMAAGPQTTYRRHGLNATVRAREGWVGILQVLRTNAARHGNCRECRRALRKGLRTVRTNYLQVAFWDEFRQARKIKGFMGSTGWLVSRFLREPSVIPAFALRPVHRLVWRYRPDLRLHF